MKNLTLAALLALGLFASLNAQAQSETTIITNPDGTLTILRCYSNGFGVNKCFAN